MTMRVFVTVGTDHHPFARLIEWVDRWAEPRSEVDLVVQHGSSPKSKWGRNLELLGATDLRAEYDLADLVVGQVGPGTIFEANRAGHRPVVVPRDPAFGEVVDGHQYPFGTFMTAQARCWAETSEQDFIRRLDMLRRNPLAGRFDAATDGDSASGAVKRLAEEAVSAPRRGFSLRRAAQMARKVEGKPDE
ncbi:glycosyl transferase family 28 [Actinomycetales bacterium SN12]|nr:glycosyl transferase family 28 [Actinomycetales bacterium SN12]